MLNYSICHCIENDNKKENINIQVGDDNDVSENKHPLLPDNWDKLSDIPSAGLPTWIGPK